MIPDPTDFFSYNRYLYARGNPLSNNDPTGHETGKPSWWPDWLPFSLDVPDEWSKSGWTEWAGENNVPTGFGAQMGADLGGGIFLGANSSVEGGYIIDFISGELTFVGNISGGARGGTPQASISLHGGPSFIIGATSNGQVIGASQATTIDAGGKGIWGGSATWARAYDYVDLNGNKQFDLVGPDGFSEHMGVQIFDGDLMHTVDVIALNATVGVDFFGDLGMRPVGTSYSVVDTNEGYTFYLGDFLQSIFVDPYVKAYEGLTK
jgi:hypothetical protein